MCRHGQTPALRPLLSRLRLTLSRSRRNPSRSRTIMMMTWKTMMTSATATANTTESGDMTMTDELVIEARKGGPCAELGDRCRAIEAASGCFCAAVADRIEALNQEVKDLKKLVFAAYCEGFSDGKDGGWIVGPSNQPWKASDTHKTLLRMESRND